MNETKSAAPGDELLRVENLSGERFQDISFSVRKSEIVALAGLVGAGRSEITRTIFGMDARTGGQVRLEGRLCDIRHPADAIAHGIGYVPEDRKQQGLFLDMSVQENILAGTFASDRAVSATEQRQIAARFKDDLRIQTPTL
ncbi:MAG: ATP-binding cassette domain-containing protein, partial [Cytophagales bacterium]|nr:ATP-binding cassette domain-containing protein [Cytophagales bacterium]